MDIDIPHYILAITGASGACYGLALANAMLSSGAHVHVTISEAGKQVLSEETGSAKLNAGVLTNNHSKATEWQTRLHTYPIKDIGSRLASGSFRHDGMVVAPCTSGSMGMIAQGTGHNLIHRAALVALKERMPLILLHRETPLSLIDIRNMEQLTLSGATIMPASPAFYWQPKSLEDIADWMAARVMKLLAQQLPKRMQWRPMPED